MYIKSIRIHGFKSYRDEVVIDDLSPGLNMILGENGSGKSNILLALTLALCPDSRPHSRHDFISSGNLTQEAKIEIQLDNSDGLVPGYGDTIIIKKMIYPDTSKFYINKKIANLPHHLLLRLEFINSLYYIKQGEVMEMAMCRDGIRLGRILEVIGYKNWEEKSKDSKAKLDSLKEVQLKNGTKKLEELKNLLEKYKKEAEEATKYQEAEKRITSISKILLSHEVEKLEVKSLEIREECRPLEDRRRLLLNEWSKMQDDAIGAKDEHDLFLATFGDVEMEREVTKPEIIKNLDEVEGRIAGLTFEISSLNEKCHKLKKLESDQKNLRSEGSIKDLEGKVKKYGGYVDGLSENVHKARVEVDEKRSGIRILKEKLQLSGGGGEISDSEKKSYEKQKKSELESLEADYKSGRKSLKEAKKRLEILKTTFKLSLNNLEDSIVKFKDLGTSLQVQKLKLKTQEALRRNGNEFLQKVWVLKSKTSRQLNFMKEKSIFQELALASVAGKTIYKSVKIVRKIIEKFKISADPEDEAAAKKYFGILLENIIEVQPQLRTAVEVAGGKKFFFHIVKDSETAKRIMTDFNAQKNRGEVNFFILDKISNRTLQSPPSSPLTHEEPLIAHIKFNPIAQKAFEMTFGSFYLCQDVVDFSNKATRNKSLNFVMVDGTLLRGNGPMTGGYYDTSKSVLSSSAELKKLVEAEKTLRLNLETIIQDENKLSEELKEIGEEYNRLESSIEKDLKEREELELWIQLLRSGLKTNGADQQNAILLLETLSSNMDAISGEIQTRRADLKEMVFPGVDIHVILQKEVEELVNLENSFGAKNADLHRLKSRKLGLEAELRGLKEELVDRELNKENDLEVLECTLATAEEDLRKAKEDKTELEKKLESLEERYEGLTKDGLALSNYLKRVIEVVKEKGEILATVEKNLNTLINKKEAILEKLNEKRNELARLENLFALDPEDEEYEELRRKNRDELRKLLRESREGRSSEVRSVNFGALGSVEVLEKQIQKVQEEIEGMNGSIALLEELLLIQRNYGPGGFVSFVNDVEKKMELVYRDLIEGYEGYVCKGTPRLRIFYEELSPPDSNGSQDENEVEPTPPPAQAIAENRVMKGARLEILSDDNIRHEIRTLSGGQKTMLAFTFFVALQQNLNSNLFLFDEIDQALDRDFRKVVASKLKNLTPKKPQVFCTTFSREFVEEADKVFYVTSHSNASRVEEIPKDLALDLNFLTSIKDDDLCSELTLCSSLPDTPDVAEHGSENYDEHASLNETPQEDGPSDVEVSDMGSVYETAREWGSSDVEVNENEDN